MVDLQMMLVDLPSHLMLIYLTKEFMLPRILKFVLDCSIRLEVIIMSMRTNFMLELIKIGPHNMLSRALTMHIYFILIC